MTQSIIQEHIKSIYPNVDTFFKTYWLFEVIYANYSVNEEENEYIYKKKCASQYVHTWRGKHKFNEINVFKGL